MLEISPFENRTILQRQGAPFAKLGLVRVSACSQGVESGMLVLPVVFSIHALVGAADKDIL